MLSLCWAPTPRPNLGIRDPFHASAGLSIDVGAGKGRLCTGGALGRSARTPRYVGSSAKSEATIDRSDRRARCKLLGQIVADAYRPLELASQTENGLPIYGQDQEAIADASVSLKERVDEDRIVSVHDPKLRSCHKSSKRGFDGYRPPLAVDTESQLIAAVDVLAGNAWDSTGALRMAEPSEANAAAPVVDYKGDTAYGDGGTRPAFVDAGRKLVARVPRRPNGKHFPKEDFIVDLTQGSRTCPAGQLTRQMAHMATRTYVTGCIYKMQGFPFDSAVGGACPLCPLGPRAVSGSGEAVGAGPGLVDQFRHSQRSLTIHLSRTVCDSCRQVKG